MAAVALLCLAHGLPGYPVAKFPSKLTLRHPPSIACRLNFGNPWELERLNVGYPISFYGHVSGVCLCAGQQPWWCCCQLLHETLPVAPVSVH